MKILLDKNSNYKYMEMTEEVLRLELVNWCWQDVINWLKWNDPNGIYREQESIKEIGSIMTKDEGVDIMINQIYGK